MSAGWKGVKKNSPCPACGGIDRCASNGELLHCFRSKDAPVGMRFVKHSEDDPRGAIFAKTLSDGVRPPERRNTRSAARHRVVKTDLQQVAMELREQLTKQLRDALAVHLGVTGESLDALRLGWATEQDLSRLKVGFAKRVDRTVGAYAIPEVDADGRVRGFSFRTANGSKGAASGDLGAQRGLVIPSDLTQSSGTILVVEGASDVAALHSLGIRAVGRPSNTGGAELLTRTLKDELDVIVLGENDEKGDGRFPGREGMQKIASRLAAAWGRAVQASLPPPPAKDVRAWLQAQVAGGLSLDDRGAREAAGRALLSELRRTAVPVAPTTNATADIAGVPELELVPGERPQAARAVEISLSELGGLLPEIFQRQGTLVRVVRLERSESGKVSTDAGALVIREVTESFLSDRIARAVRLVRKNQRGERRRIDPPAELARAVLSRAGEWPFPCLVGIVEAPQIFRDGRVLCAPGFDRTSGLLLEPGTFEFAPVPDLPTEDDARRALDTIDEELLTGFEFVDPHDRSAALALILSGVGRSAFSTAPAFCITAPNRSCGKSTLASLAAILTTGRGPVVIAPGRSEEEADKRSLSVLQDGHRHVCYDNIRSGEELDRPAFAKVVTEPVFSGRPLGRTGTLSLSTEGVVWTCTGVGIVPTGDAHSRTVVIRLDPGVERPWNHRWSSPDPRIVARDRRSVLVPAALTVLRAYVVAGRPRQEFQPSRFKEWDQAVRSTLIWLGRPDPLSGLLDEDARDPEDDELCAVLETWEQVIGNSGVTVATAVEKLMSASPTVRSAVLAVAVSNDSSTLLDPRRLGRYLSKVERRVAGGRRLIRLGSSGSRARWAVETVRGHSGTSTERSTKGDDAPASADVQRDPAPPGPDSSAADCRNCENCDSGDVVCETTCPVPVTGDSRDGEQAGAMERVGPSPQLTPHARRADDPRNRVAEPASRLDVHGKSSLHVDLASRGCQGE